MARLRLILILGLVLAGCRAGSDPTGEPRFYAQARSKMVGEQLEERGIADARLLQAMRKVPRHEFVPGLYRWFAYRDQPLPIGEGQTISQPYVVAYMIEQLRLEGDERVLEIGTGSGYQAAVLAELSKEVFTIEIVKTLAERARNTLERRGYRNVHVRWGDGYRGWPAAAPFDAVIVSAAPGHVPQPLVDQLALGGRMILPVGEHVQELVLLRRDEKGVHKEPLIGVRFVPMTGEAESRP